ncbi:type I-U CRISPR-associated RAMP protein Csb1/Cas7u [Nocardia sp. NPDC127606]|uniref:type I-G CRISPR-associated RAMP protein Csb1/Cas7g n=1 Tax=Nocardia sp. NPDC127606 TaxID=3345406 RepID=UPI0036444A68
MTNRYVYDVELAPLLGSTFQPTGFPDIGAAVFNRFEDGKEIPSLLVESVQSMANRLEATAWNIAANAPRDEVSGLPWVRVVRSGTDDFLTSSRLEAHRLASPFVHTATLNGKTIRSLIAERMNLTKDTPLDRARIVRTVAELDPFCLLHGVFFAHKDWLGQPRFPRVTSAVIEAHHVQKAVSGGRKADIVRHQLDKDGDGGGTSEGYGSVPFTRVEWTAKEIVASFAVDVGLIRSYGLPQSATELLESLALWEIRQFLDGDLRLRTACDLEMISETRPRRDTTPPLPSATELEQRITAGLAAAAGSFGDGEPITVEWSGKKS